MPDPVVITRPRAQGQALADSVAALGREAVLLPLLEIFPLADQAALQRVLAGLADYALVAFVSPNAIDAALGPRRALAGRRRAGGAGRGQPRLPGAATASMTPTPPSSARSTRRAATPNTCSARSTWPRWPASAC